MGILLEDKKHFLPYILLEKLFQMNFWKEELCSYPIGGPDIHGHTSTLSMPFHKLDQNFLKFK